MSKEIFTNLRDKYYKSRIKRRTKEELQIELKKQAKEDGQQVARAFEYALASLIEHGTLQGEYTTRFLPKNTEKVYTLALPSNQDAQVEGHVYYRPGQKEPYDALVYVAKQDKRLFYLNGRIGKEGTVENYEFFDSTNTFIDIGNYSARTQYTIGENSNLTRRNVVDIFVNTMNRLPSGKKHAELPPAGLQWNPFYRNHPRI